MRLTPIDLINKRFPTGFKGYARGAVDDYLREVASDYEETVAENARLHDAMGALEREVERYRSIEKTLQDALLLAQRTADELRATAHREADAILQDARLRAQSEVEDARSTLEDLRQQRLQFCREFRALLRSHLDGLGGDMSARAVVADDDGTGHVLVGGAGSGDTGTSGLGAVG